MPQLWNAAKAKVQLRLSVQRLRTLQQKKEAQAKAYRRDVATLIERGKIETARVKAETIINEDIYVELLELLELYCELLLARFGLLDQNTREPDAGIIEGVCCVIYSAPHTELKELHILRDILMHKYGREFAIKVMENRDGCVSDRIVRKLALQTPSADLVDAYLAEIAKGYGVDWMPPSQVDDSQDSPDGGVKELELDNKDTQAPALSSASVQLNAPSPEPRSSEKSASDKEKKLTSTSSTIAPVTPKSSTPTPEVEDDFEALSKRFAALKKR